MTLRTEPVPTLRQLQQSMLASLLPALDGESYATGSLAAWLEVPAQSDVEGRLGVYRGGYPLRIAEALADAFPAIAALLGEADFAALARRYAGAVGLTSYNLNDAGAALPAFLRGDPAAARRPYLPDLAALEWNVAAAFHAYDLPPLDPRTLGWTADDWANAVLEFQPSLRLLTSRWPLLELWPRRDGEPADIAARSPARHFLVRRVGLVVHCEAIATGEAAVLRRLRAGRTLADALQSIATHGTESGDVGEWFGRWVGSGMVVAARRGP